MVEPTWKLAAAPAVVTAGSAATKTSGVLGPAQTGFNGAVGLSGSWREQVAGTILLVATGLVVIVEWV